MIRNWIGLVVLFSVVNFSLTETQQKCNSYGTALCNDGECINSNLFCDGINNCKDGSDEYPSICSRPYDSNDRITNSTKMKRAIMPENGCMVSDNVDVLTISTDSKQILPPSTYVDQFTSVQYSCRPKRVLEGVPTNICVDGKWTNPEPICSSYCSGFFLKGVTFTATCEYNRNNIPCEGHLKTGTIAKIACQEGYQKPDNRNVQDVIRCDEFGEWDYNPFHCDPICGIENTESTPLILGGERSDLNVVPWHAAIYIARRNGYEQICGGTIINAKIIISAAHCFWLENLDTVVNHSLITVGVGKVYRNISAEEPFGVQYLNVSEIYVSNQYQGVMTGYQNDIAILVLTDHIQFTSKVRPICLEWQDYQEKYMRSGIVGRLAGWGSTGTELARNELRIVDLPAISYDNCRNDLEPRFRNSVTGDKFCVASPDGGMPGQGDEGGGFVVPKYNRTNGVTTYFLAGVVSIALTDKGQSSRSYTTLTNIQYHQLMIVNYEAISRPK